MAPASSPPPTLVWASIESDPFVRGPSATPGRLVWMVRLEGGLAAPSCDPGDLDEPPSTADKPCQDADGGLVVVLDFFTGAFLGWTH